MTFDQNLLLQPNNVYFESNVYRELRQYVGFKILN